MYEKNRFKSYNGLERYYGQTESAVQEVKDTLPVSVAVDTEEVKQKFVDPQKFIPAKTGDLNWMQARKYLRRPVGSAPKVNPVSKAKGDVYWTAKGPKFSDEAIKDASKAEKVPPPEPVWKPNIRVVRDKPKIELPPIEMPTEAAFQGLGEWSSPKILLPVLGLIIGACLLYRR